MTSSQVYPSLPGHVDPDHLRHDPNAVCISGADWYPPTSYAYNDSYMTPFPSTTVESQPWTQYAASSAPALSLGTYAVHTPVHPHPMFKDPGRPRSSPSSFGPSPDSLSWTATTGLGIHGLPYTTTAGEHPSPPAVTPTFPPTVFHNYPNADHYLASSPPEIRQPQPRRPYTTIAPNPIGDAKRKRDEMEQQHQELASSGGGKRRKRTSSVASADLSDEDRFLVQLKEDENLPWKDIATRFHTDKGKHFQVAALQMRYKRLREKFRVWEDQDVQALKLAHEYWEKYKWEIISAKMLDFGVQERWPARHCARKWQDLDVPATATATTATDTMTASSNPPPALPTNVTPKPISHFSSPVDSKESSLTTNTNTTPTTTTAPAAASTPATTDPNLHYAYMPTQ